MDNINFSQLFHQNTKQINKMIPLDETKWPREWLMKHYKTYPRLERIKLFHGEVKFDLFDSISKRSSKRDMSGEKMNLQELSTILKYSCGLTQIRKGGDYGRAYPSGGARYPIETYCLVLHPGEGLRHGLFHYNVKSHSLEVLWDKCFSEEEISKIASYEFISDSAVIFFLTSIFERTQMKYGERGYRFILQESGHIGQNISLISEALNLKCCSVGGFRVSDVEIEKILDIDGINESLVYTLVVGR